MDLRRAAVEYLVTMTTHVPAGTAEDTVAGVRAREAARSAELAAQGHLLRLWRPPLQPGEWRTLGLFAADDGGQLEDVLASMPLRVWRSDEVTPLLPHRNDPGPGATRPRPAAGAGEQAAEFLTTFTRAGTAATPAQPAGESNAQEAQRAAELAGQGHLRRLWVLPGEGRALGLWQAQDPGEMQAILESLPAREWLAVETTPLSPHPSDPAVTMR